MGLFSKFKGKSFDDYVAEAKAQDIRIVDVREPHEFAQGHIPGAYNVPLASLARIAEVEPSRGKPLYVHCRSGMRSSKACRQLKSMGYTSAVNIGGINAYHGPIVQ